ncbi:hypothetical protein B0A52_08077 [Exophiala mesophila]|uniref:HIG1 domain-containing protein n=1 Tax=Exophiala mesophila TaxID=212818 RepID=A0A438MZY4_EXOME|nr:hypothetical protein B0A52_08077 [Exophiala mesophila]
MKVLTKEQEAEHYRAVLRGGTIGGVVGLGVGLVGVTLAQRRYAFIRNLTLPLKAFLVTSSGTFAGIINADTYSRQYEADQNPKERQYREREAQKMAAAQANRTFTEKAMEFGRRERYKIVAGSWVASMAAAFAIVNRNKYITGPQKLVQARVYAQFLTLGVLIATAAFEIADSRNQEGRFETVRYLDPTDPEHKRYLEKQVELETSQGHHNPNDDLWKEMVAAEEERLHQREVRHKELEKEHHKRNNGGHKKASKKPAADEQEEK